MQVEGEGSSVAVAEAAVDRHTRNVSGAGMQFCAAARHAVLVALKTLVGTVKRRRETLSSRWWLETRESQYSIMRAVGKGREGGSFLELGRQ